MELYRIIRETIIDAFPGLAGEDFDIQTTPENQPGDLGLACFRFAKAMRKAPQQIAAGIAGLTYPAPVASAEAIGPYCNFSLDREAFAGELVGSVMRDGATFGSSGEGTGRTVLLEHTSINPNASPHIGRSRNGLIGDTLARLFRYQGFDVDVHYYVNDMGKQIGLLVMEAEGRDEISRVRAVHLIAVSLADAINQAHLQRDDGERGQRFGQQLQRGVGDRGVENQLVHLGL